MSSTDEVTMPVAKHHLSTKAMPQSSKITLAVAGGILILTLILGIGSLYRRRRQRLQVEASARLRRRISPVQAAHNKAYVTKAWDDGNARRDALAKAQAQSQGRVEEGMQLQTLKKTYRKSRFTEVGLVDEPEDVYEHPRSQWKNIDLEAL